MKLKNKVLSGMMLSLVVLSATAPLTKVKADSFDAQIAAQNAKIEAASGNAAQAKAAADEMQKQVDDANARLTQLQAESDKLHSQITTLQANIKERNASLQAQARSAQTEGGASSYINTILNAKSLTDVVQKVTAMSQVVNTSNQMMKQQKADELALQQKLVASQKAYDDAYSVQQQLAVQEQQLQAAQLSYQATIATAQDQKDSLLSQKAAVEAQAAAVAKAQAEAIAASNAASAAAAAAHNNAGSSSNTNTNTKPASNNTGGNSGGSLGSPGYSSSNPYPAGQCTAYVWAYFGGNIPTYQGNAGDWIVYANSGAAPGTIAVFSAAQAGNPYGHVAVVTSVSGNMMHVIEGNYLGIWGHERDIPVSSASGFIRP